CNSRWVGFVSAETTGKDLLNAINYCKQQIAKKGDLTQTTVTTLRHWSNANRFDTELGKKPSSINDIILIAAMDSFSPCALFCFAGFLAFLLIEKQRKKQIIASLLFISSVALVHYFQQVQTNIFFELLLWLRIPAALVGLFTIYFVMFYYKNLTTGSLYFLLAFLLGLFTTTYQQTCVMNLAAVFEQWLNNQEIPGWQLNLYQLLYQSIYILPLLLFLIVYLFLLQMKRFTALQARLSSMGLLFMIAIALILIINPFVLSYFTTSLFTLIILVICAYFLNLT
ncbi:MAG: hypothetical protein HYX60_06085, partial [Legionella longbeachae]|nr:hypothetical protein [Legionella longbeachae]